MHGGSSSCLWAGRRCSVTLETATATPCLHRGRGVSRACERWSPVNELRIRALGGLDVEVDGRPLSAPVPAKGHALLAYLAMVDGRAERSRLAGLLWSDLPEPSARQNLRLVLTRRAAP